MRTITESSYLSKYSENSGYSFTGLKMPELESMEIDIFHRITDLRDHKIYLMGVLSHAIDEKNQNEDRLIKAIQKQKKKQKQYVSPEHCKQIIQKFYHLKQLESDLEQKIPKNHSLALDSVSQEEIINQIIEKRKENTNLETLSAVQNNPNILKSVASLKQLLEEITIDINNLELVKQQEQLSKQPQKPNIEQMLKYIEEQEENKRLLYQELIQFQKQMQDLRIENEGLRNKLNIF